MGKNNGYRSIAKKEKRQVTIATAKKGQVQYDLKCQSLTCLTCKYMYDVDDQDKALIKVLQCKHLHEVLTVPFAG